MLVWNGLNEKGAEMIVKICIQVCHVSLTVSVPFVMSSEMVYLSKLSITTVYMSECNDL